MCARGFFLGGVAVFFSFNAYRVFGILAHLKECPLQHRFLLHKETYQFVCFPRYVVKIILFIITKKNRNEL